jgi:bacterioferritin-associated ferredoxin
MKGEVYMVVDKQLAQQMREAGHTYKHIAQTIGCSEDWCKRNLSKVVKNTKEKEILAQTIELAQSKDGVTNQQIRNVIRTFYPTTFSKEDKLLEDKMFNKIKTQLRKEDNCVVRPYWMQPQQANESFIALMQATKLVSDRIEEEVVYFLNLFNLDSSYVNSVRWAIVSLTYAGSKFGSGTDAQSTIDNLERLVHEMQNRNTTTMHYINTSVSSCAPNDVIGEKSVLDDFDVLNYFDEASHYLDCKRDNKWDGDE